MRRCWLVLLLIVAVVPDQAGANPVPPGATYSSTSVATADGTRLHADVLLPSGAERADPIIVLSPYLGLQGSDLTAPAIPAKYSDLIAGAFRRGYAVVLVSMRGFGASGGCRDLGGSLDQADAAAVAAWARDQPWSTGRVAMWGLSTDAWAALMAVARRVRGLRAVVAIAPVVSAYRISYERGVRYTPFADLVEPFYAAHALVPLTFNDPAQVAAGLERLIAHPTCGLVAQAGATADPATEYWRARDLRPALRGARVPLFWTHGFIDSNVRSGQVLPTWRAWRGPRRAWLGQFPHAVPPQARTDLLGRGGFAREAFRFLRRHVRGRPLPRRDPRVAVQEGSAGTWRAERAWPPAGRRRRTLRLLGGPVVLAPGNKAEPSCVPAPGTPVTALDPSCLPGATGRGLWSLSTPLRSPAWLAGAPTVRVDVTGTPAGGQVVALLYDVDAAGAARLVSRAATLVGGPGPVVLRLAPQDWRFAPGHRVGVLLTTADDLWFAPPAAVGQLEIAGGSLVLPALRRPRRGSLPDTGPSGAVLTRTSFPVPDDALKTRITGDLSP